MIHRHRDEQVRTWPRDLLLIRRFRGSRPGATPKDQIADGQLASERPGSVPVMCPSATGPRRSYAGTVGQHKLAREYVSPGHPGLYVPVRSISQADSASSILVTRSPRHRSRSSNRFHDRSSRTRALELEEAIRLGNEQETVPQTASLLTARRW